MIYLFRTVSPFKSFKSILPSFIHSDILLLWFAMSRLTIKPSIPNFNSTLGLSNLPTSCSFLDFSLGDDEFELNKHPSLQSSSSSTDSISIQYLYHTTLTSNSPIPTPTLRSSRLIVKHSHRAHSTFSRFSYYSPPSSPIDQHQSYQEACIFNSSYSLLHEQALNPSSDPNSISNSNSLHLHIKSESVQTPTSTFHEPQPDFTPSARRKSR